MLRFLLLAALVVAPVPVPAPSSGSNSPAPTLPKWSWKGAPAATTTDCFAVAGRWKCRGATAQTTGAPTAAAGTAAPGTAAPVAPAIHLDGVSDFVDAVGAARCSGSMTMCVAYWPDDLTTLHALWGRWPTSKGGLLYSNNAFVYFDVATGDETLIGQLSPGAWNFVCGSYERIGAGTSKLLSSLNGSSGWIESSTAGLASEGTSPLRLGQIDNGTWPTPGRFARATQWCDWAATSTQLNTMTSGT